MFKIFKDLTKATVGIVIVTPVAVVADVLTLGGTLTDTEEPYTATAVENVMQNIENAGKPRHK